MAPAQKSPGERVVGDFVLIEEIGRGGMGVVYKARQKSLDRAVALKVLPSFASMDPRTVRRFKREAEATGRLAHPGIVPVYTVGQEDGVHYYAMELVEGASLSELLENLADRDPALLRRSLTEEAGCGEAYPALRDPPGDSTVGSRYARSCAFLAAEIASALATAHHARLIHRDVKPSNVLMHPDGRPVLVDFGLARDQTAPRMTATGDALGTPAYMAPEQAAGEVQIDARVDVYGLGAVLYEMLGLRPPFTGLVAAEIMHRILHEEPVALRKLNPEVPPDLETIVHTCLAKSPGDRYWSMDAVEMDLRGFLEGYSIFARPPSLGRRVKGALRRQRKVLTGVAVTLLLVAAIWLVAGFVTRGRLGEAGRQALEEARVALVEEMSIDTARDHYSRAGLLVEDEALLRQARLAHMREAFDRHYPENLSFLSEWMASLPAAEREALSEIEKTIAGRGTISLGGMREADRRTAWLSYRSFREGSLAAEWQPVPDDRVLPIGQYLVKIEVAGKAPVCLRVDVKRDADTALDLYLHDQGVVPSGMVVVVAPDVDRGLAVAASELSARDYAALLAGLPSDVSRELLPAGWTGPQAVDGDRPVRGLSFRQARAAAALAGAHLPSLDEFVLAASAGLDGLDYPWGNRFDPERVVADPNYRQAPEAVRGSKEGGASPGGILHLWGNVAEILSPRVTGRYVVAGGHYQSEDASRMRLTRPDSLVAALPGPDAQLPFAGMRLARFLPEAEDPEEVLAAERRRKQLLDSPRGFVLHDWTVGKQGGVRYALELGGFHRRAVSEQPWRIFTDGFVQVGSLAVRDGHGRDHRVTVRRSPDGETSDLSIHLDRPARPGEPYRLRIASDLVPTTGLYGMDDAYVLRIATRTVETLPVVPSLTLPAGCGIKSVQPPPTWRYQHAGRTKLVWEFLPGTGRLRTIPLVVRFRRDGPLTDRWPTLGSVEPLVHRFFDALASGEGATLGPLLDPAYLELPSGLGRSQLVQGGSVVGGRRFADQRLLDVTAVGSVVTVDLDATWAAGHDRPLVSNWPLRLQLRRTGAGLRALRLQPRARWDDGEVGRDGQYRHERLSVSLRPPARVPLSRTQHELTEMQVLCVKPGEERLKLQVLGHYARDAETPKEIRFLLTSGAIELRPGKAVEPTPVAGFDALARGRVAHRSDWLFGTSEAGGWSRESWLFLTLGRRNILIKAIAEGRDAADARERHREGTAWFEEAIGMVTIL